MNTAVKMQQEGHDKRATGAHWLQDLDLGCVTQAGDLYHLLDEEGKTRLVDYVVTAMRSVPEEIQMRQIGHFMKADPVYGEAVAAGLGLALADTGQA